ncbi:hypothetical protein M9H77_36611 [Catharanthus roseus]|uniref:Uncharacterized protein n=1 Tax=Catharanthus roseus TaxID=4058 RepID=A0ACB9ZUW0_CATRO|nr:hypothetical protein M9H77_36611 [Catharanthus roseus]
MIISRILNMHPLSSIGNAYNMIIREERHSFITRDQEARAEAIAFDALVKADKSGLICTVSHKSGHASLDYFQVTRLPDWWPDKSKLSFGKSDLISKNSGRANFQEQWKSTWSRRSAGQPRLTSPSSSISDLAALVTNSSGRAWSSVYPIDDDYCWCRDWVATMYSCEWAATMARLLTKWASTIGWIYHAVAHLQWTMGFRLEYSFN